MPAVTGIAKSALTYNATGVCKSKSAAKFCIKAVIGASETKAELASIRRIFIEAPMSRTRKNKTPALQIMAKTCEKSGRQLAGSTFCTGVVCIICGDGKSSASSSLKSSDGMVVVCTVACAGIIGA